MEPIVRQLIADFQEARLPAYVPRTARVPDVPGTANVVIGARRSGKTYFLYQQVDEMLRGGVPKSGMLYVNFEDERLAGLTSDQLHLVSDLFYRLHPENREGQAWLFFDEIQVVDGWERYVRRLLDTENVRVFLSGSSSKLLSREIATSMRGRAMDTLLFPFSFAEALTAAGVELPGDPTCVGKNLRSALENRSAQYLEIGGFPAVQNLGLLDRRQLLQSYVEVAIFRDVVERHSVGNLVLLKRLVRQLLGNPACLFSANRFYRQCKSHGLSCAKDTILQYLDHLSDCLLIVPVALHTESERRRQTNPVKVYPIDPGLAAAYRIPGRAPQGHLLESVVLLELMRRGAGVNYVRTPSGHEVDFCATHPDGTMELVQVCAEIADPDTRERELRSLPEAVREYGLDGATLVTLYDEGTHEAGGTTVNVVPAWRWLLR